LSRRDRRWRATLFGLCRSIKTLRVLVEPAPDVEVRAAALQYVRKVSGYRKPSPANEHAFNHAVEEIALASSRLLQAVTATHPARRAS
jgi:hypothetical protein